MPKYIIVGCLGIDHIILSDGRNMPRQAGGDAYYGAAGAHVWSNDVGIVAVIPKTYPQGLVDKLQQSGMDISGIIRNNLKMGLEGTIEYKADGSRVLGAARGVFKFLQDHVPGLLALIGKPYWRKVSPQADLIPKSYLNAKGVFLASMAYANQAECLRLFHERVKNIILDPPPLMPWIRRGRPPQDLADLSMANFVLPSEQEAFEYWGDGISPDDAAERFFSLGARNIAFKMGERGAKVYLNGQRKAYDVPIYKTKAVDITGAGDSFGGGFLVGLAETGDPIKAACYGAVSASFVVEGFGADYALQVTRQQAEERFEKLFNLA
ncbi:MAG: carbohydrate kinase family protein [Spirochaetota bacterium]